MCEREMCVRERERERERVANLIDVCERGEREDEKQTEKV